MPPGLTVVFSFIGGPVLVIVLILIEARITIAEFETWVEQCDGLDGDA
jgi:hypothetical protein